MQHLTEKVIAKLQREFKKFKHIQFVGMGTNPAVFKQELKMLQCLNIINLKPSNIAKAEWATAVSTKAAAESITVEVGSILARAADLEDEGAKYFKSVSSPWVYIPSLNVAGLYNKAADKIILDKKTVIREPYLSTLTHELRYIKLNAINKLVPALSEAHVELIKTATKSGKARGFAVRPAIGDKFRIRDYKDMKTEFGEKSGSIQVENDDGELEPLALKLIPSISPIYGSPFVNMWSELCGVEGTITGFDKVTGIIKASYIIAGKKVTSITSLTDKDGEEIELADPLVIHEQHIMKI